VLAPRFRPAYVVVILMVAVGLLVADFHFVSDILAGGVAGWMVGLFVARVDLPKAEPQA
jgi:membrane-associated phospholipid phosphatase